MKKIQYILLFLFIWPVSGYTQYKLTGTVRSKERKVALSRAGLVLKVGKTRTLTGTDGSFMINAVVLPDTLIVSYMGFKPLSIGISAGTSGKNLQLFLEADAAALDEIMVNTGYYQIPQERATGSFTHIDNKLLNRSVSTNILDRLEGVTNSLLFDRRNITKENVAGAAPELRVRGLSTIESNGNPLIVVDNFPYEGDLTSINPNDVESITILKDAAAASIWGARAGNGVIVINTKSGKFNQPVAVSFSSSTNSINKPDLYYNKSWLPSATVMEIEKELFNRKAYAENNQTRIPAYVELLIRQRDHTISESAFVIQESMMKQTDLREQSLKYLYQVALNQQYALNVSGGGAAYRYYLSAGYDNNRAAITGNNSNRLNLNMQNTFKLGSCLELSGGIWYSRQRSATNGLSHNDIGLTYGGVDQYVRLADEQGNALPVGRPGYRLAYQQEAINNGLLDWLYRPLDEQRLADNTSNSSELRLNGGLKYSFLKYFNVQATYQYILGNNTTRTYYAPESFYTRDLINKYTQPNGQQVVPLGGIMDHGAPVSSSSHSGRFQFNYQQQLEGGHQFAALAGAEIREQISLQTPGNRLYRYDAQLGTGLSTYDYTTRYALRPQGVGYLPMGAFVNSRSVGHDLSYFGNAAYTYLDRYAFSGSLRWDGSNLMGVKTNQRGTVLWSAGLSWELNKEKFYGMNDWLPYLRLRLTYGSAGNLDKSQSYFPTISLGTNTVNGLPVAELTSPGNPSLRWEQVNTFNLGLDWKLFNDRLNGNIEYYDKHAKHLLGTNLMDPTSGTGESFKMNYANLRTNGLDMEIRADILTRAFSWQSSLLLNFSYNKVTNLNLPVKTTVNSEYWSSAPLVVGQSRDLMYAFPWHGLNGETGQPLLYVNGQISNDYKAYYTNFKPEDLLIVGKTVPPLFGSVRNNFSWKGIELSALISFKTGYVFRRKSMYPGEEYVVANPVYHEDYFKRWKKPGDERFTDVPAHAIDRSEQRMWVYQYAQALITPGDAIRIQDVNLSYTFSPTKLRHLPVKNLRIYAYARNLGILWRANKNGLDPDFPNADYPAPKSYAFGLQANF